MSKQAERKDAIHPPLIHHGNGRGGRPQGAVRRRFELFAAEQWLDNDGNVLQFSHGYVAQLDVEPEDRAVNAQRTFDEWLEEEIFWNHHLNNAPDQGEGDEEDYGDGSQIP